MKQVIANGHRFGVHDSGTGQVILFVHGFPLDHSMWRKQLAEFQADYRVIAPDLRGFGRSGVVEGTAEMGSFADDLAAILDELNITEPIVFCGLSMGGYIGWQFVRKYPARLRALIQCDTRAIADDEASVKNRHRLAEIVLEKGPETVAATMVPNLFVQPCPEAGETKNVVENTDPRSIAAAARGLACRPDISKELASISLPTLVLVGRHDKISTVEEMRSIAQTIPNAQFAVIEEAGHMAPLENAEQSNAVIREFIDGLP